MDRVIEIIKKRIKASKKGFITYEELAGLLGHEFAHLEKQHSLKNLSKNFTFNMLLSFTLGDLTGINAILLEQASLFNSLNYSREFETDC